MPWAAGLDWGYGAPTTIVDGVTPWLVTPPLSPFHGGTQGGANSDGIFSRPVVGSQAGSVVGAGGAAFAFGPAVVPARVPAPAAALPGFPAVPAAPPALPLAPAAVASVPAAP